LRKGGCGKGAGQKQREESAGSRYDHASLI
jgi:hypothetical protein